MYLNELQGSFLFGKLHLFIPFRMDVFDLSSLRDELVSSVVKPHRFTFNTFNPINSDTQ